MTSGAIRRIFRPLFFSESPNWHYVNWGRLSEKEKERGVKQKDTAFFCWPLFVLLLLL